MSDSFSLFFCLFHQIFLSVQMFFCQISLTFSIIAYVERKSNSLYMKNQFKKQFPSFLLETRNCFSLLSSYIIFQYISLQEHQYNLMIPVSKGQKAVRACTIRLLNLGHAKYEVQNIQWMFVLHRPKRSVDSSDLRSKSADFEYFI